MSVLGHFFFFCGDAMFVIFFLRFYGVAGGCGQGVWTVPHCRVLLHICITGFTQLKYSSLLQVQFTICSIHKWFDFMNKTLQSGAQTFPFSRLRVLEKRAKRAL